MIFNKIVFNVCASHIIWLAIFAFGHVVVSTKEKINWCVRKDTSNEQLNEKLDKSIVTQEKHQALE